MRDKRRLLWPCKSGRKFSFPLLAVNQNSAQPKHSPGLSLARTKTKKRGLGEIRSNTFSNKPPLRLERLLPNGKKKRLPSHPSILKATGLDQNAKRFALNEARGHLPQRSTSLLTLGLYNFQAREGNSGHAIFSAPQKSGVKFFFFSTRERREKRGGLMRADKTLLSLTSHTAAEEQAGLGALIPGRG